MLIAILILLIIGIKFETSMLFYITYQITFTFGSYLYRAESVFLEKRLSQLDSLKQLGYLIGMGVSTIYFYLLTDLDLQSQVYYLHYLFLLLQSIIVMFTFLSFSREK